MSITKFNRTFWSAKIQTQLDELSGAKDHSDFQFEGEVKHGAKLKINGVARPRISDYVKGTPIDLEFPTDSEMELIINQQKYFNIAVEDIDKVQSTEGLISAITMESTRGLENEANKYVCSLAENAVNTSSSYAISTATIITQIEKGFEALYDNNCKPVDVFHLEVSPKFYTALRPAMTQLFTDNVDMIKKGIVGKYGNALVSIENNLYDDNTDKYCMLRTTKAIAFAGQINSVEAYRPEDAFTDAVKGLYTYGAEIIRPEQLYVIKAH